MEYVLHPQGLGHGSSALPPQDVRSAAWMPPPGGGSTVDFDRPGPHGGPCQSGQSYGGGASWDGGSGMGNSKVELPSLASTSTPLDLGDWLTVITPTMNDITPNSHRWWMLTMAESKALYERWKTSTPLDRVGIQPGLTVELAEPRYQRTEQRGVQLLLRALPDDQQQALIAARELCAVAIIYRLLVRFQPGGPGEKSLLLTKLTQLDAAADMPALALALRSWRRHYTRALEVGAVPDGTLLLQALEVGVRLIATKDSQASFRLANSRSQLQVDENPTQDRIWRFSQCMLAEAETLELMMPVNVAQTKSNPQTPARVKQLHGAQDDRASPGDSKTGKGTTVDRPCRYFASDGGCRAGKQCKWQHNWDALEDKQSRRWLCGSKEHKKSECRLRQGKGADRRESGDPGGGSGGPGVGKARKVAPAGNTTSSSATTTTTSPGTTKVKELNVPAGDGGKTTEASAADGGTPATNASADPSGNAGTGKGSLNRIDATQLLQEATQLLRAIRTEPSMKVMDIKLSATNAVSRGAWMLVDSGATHALRPARNDAEWQQAVPTKVTLANGTTDALRLKAGTKVLLANNQAGDLHGCWILPMGGLAALGFTMAWSNDSCSIVDDEGCKLEVEVQGGCPMIPMKVGGTSWNTSRSPRCFGLWQ